MDRMVNKNIDRLSIHYSNTAQQHAGNPAPTTMPTPTFTPKPQPCLQCMQHAQTLHNVQQKLKKQARKEKKLRTALSQLQAHNNSIVEDTDHTVRQFEEHIFKLENEILERDEIIRSCIEEIQELNRVNDQLMGNLEQARGQRQGEMARYEKQMNELRAHIMKQVSEKNLTEKRLKEGNREHELQKYRLRTQVKSLEQQITSKEQLIKTLSNSNNELRIQLIELKNKMQINELTWVTEKKKTSSSQTQQMYSQLRRENEHLRTLNRSLQFEINHLISETEEVESMLVRAKLERDVYQNIVERQRPKSMEPRAGTILHIGRQNLYQMHKNINEALRPGHIRFSKTAQRSMKTSVSNQIVQQDFEQGSF